MLGGKSVVLYCAMKTQRHTRPAMRMSEEFLVVCRGQKKPISEFISQAYAEKVDRNRKFLLRILDVILSLGKRGVPLRGSWRKEAKEEDSNFAFFVKWKAQDNPEFASFLKDAPRNATYLSPEIQNQLIESVAHVIRREIVNEAMKADFFSIMVDETCDVSTTEQMSVCIRYIRRKDDGSIEVAEDFLGFVQMEETNAAAITEALLSNLRKWGINLNKWRGKGFDGAPVMAGEVSGVSVRILQAVPQAKYFTHCRNHCLNLVVVNSCKTVPDIRNFMDGFRDLTFFLKNSHKRKLILKDKVQEKDVGELLSDLEVHEEELLFASNRRQGLPTLCETRWLSRVDSLSTLLVKYDQIISALKEIAQKSSGSSRNDALSYLRKMADFWFLLTAVIVQHILGYVRPVSVALQLKQCDLLLAHQECQSLLRVLKGQRDDDVFHRLYTRAARLLKENYGKDQGPEAPRAAAGKRQTHRANTPAMTVEEFYKRNYYISFLDHVISHFENRFPQEQKHLLLAFRLMPGNIHQLTDEDRGNIKKEFLQDLPSPGTYDQELDRWQQPAQEMGTDAKCQQLVDLLGSTTLAQFYPNVHAVLSLLLTLPVGSCSCERSFSALRRLKTWTRTSMGETRLNGLALLHIHREHPLVNGLESLEVLKEWDASMHRRITLAFENSQ